MFGIGNRGVGGRKVKHRQIRIERSNRPSNARDQSRGRDFGKSADGDLDFLEWLLNDWLIDLVGHWNEIGQDRLHVLDHADDLARNRRFVLFLQNETPADWFLVAEQSRRC